MRGGTVHPTFAAVKYVLHREQENAQYPIHESYISAMFVQEITSCCMLTSLVACGNQLTDAQALTGLSLLRVVWLTRNPSLQRLWVANSAHTLEVLAHTNRGVPVQGADQHNAVSAQGADQHDVVQPRGVLGLPCDFTLSTKRRELCVHVACCVHTTSLHQYADPHSTTLPYQELQHSRSICVA